MSVQGLTKRRPFRSVNDSEYRGIVGSPGRMFDIQYMPFESMVEGRRRFLLVKEKREGRWALDVQPLRGRV